jgi:hypothetical protein
MVRYSSAPEKYLQPNIFEVLIPLLARPMIELSKTRSEDQRPIGTCREAVFQLAGFYVPLLLPHRHPRIFELTVAPQTSRLLFREVSGVPVVDKVALSKRTGDYRAWSRRSPAMATSR